MRSDWLSITTFSEYISTTLCSELHNALHSTLIQSYQAEITFKALSTDNWSLPKILRFVR